MKSRRFLPVLFVASILMSGSLHAMATPTASYDVTERKDAPPRPKPTPGPRGDGDD